MFPSKTLLPCVYLALTLLPSYAVAAPLEQDIGALVGQWQGEAHDGTKVTATFAKGQGDLLATGTLKVEGGPLAEDSEFSLLRAEKLYFMVPGKTPFDGGQEAYTMSRLPAGGFKFARLSRPDAESIQSEEIEIGRVNHAGARTLKLLRGEKLCRDAASPDGKACGEPVAEQIALHKMAE